MTEHNRFSGRVKRYAKVGASVSGVAVKVAGSRLFGDKDTARSKEARDLKMALGGLKGPVMKVAQILATVPDALPNDYIKELAQLQSNAPAMGWAFVNRRMAAELGPNWQDKFGRFDHQAASAASLGQVHKASTKDGQPLACKLQYPDMASAVEADLKQLRLVFKLYRAYDKAVDPTEIHKELSARIREELDYGREAANMALYGHMLRAETGVNVPEAIPTLSTDRLLSMTWLDGNPLLSVKERDLEFRNQVALNMFRAWYVPFYHYGVIHGDPHLGNYSICDDGAVNLLDFGCIRVFEPSFLYGVIELYKALRDDDEPRAVAAYETWGFENLNKEMIDILSLWARYIYGPLLEDRVKPIDEEGGTVYGAQVANEVHQKLRKVGGVKIPREFVMVDRSAIGLGSVFMHLKAEMNWHQLFHDLIDKFDADAIQKRQTEALKAAKVPEAA